MPNVCGAACRVKNRLWVLTVVAALVVVPKAQAGCTEKGFVDGATAGAEAVACRTVGWSGRDSKQGVESDSTPGLL